MNYKYLGGRGMKMASKKMERPVGDITGRRRERREEKINTK
jgi:hypothetical protein